ncbi:MAG: hypothetical protein PVH61_00105 [Candidatus Aminicenantes bacterium]|jgi:hypothetical protein
MKKEKILAKSVKKIIRWGKGLSVFVTKEARLFKWDKSTYVSVIAVRDDEGERIIIKKIEGLE